MDGELCTHDRRHGRVAMGFPQKHLGYIESWSAVRILLLLGQTTLTFYVLHMLLIAILMRTLPGGTMTIWDLLYDKLVAMGLGRQFASLLFSLLAGALCCCAMPLLKRKGWVLKL